MGSGLSGYVTTSANGFTRRWAQPGDVSRPVQRVVTVWLGFLWMTFTYNAMQNNQTVAKAVIRSMVEKIAAGGVKYKWGG